MKDHDLVIMYSGGLDSYISYFYAKSKGYNPLLVWVDINSPYGKKEEAAIDALGLPVRKIKCPVLHEDYGNMPTVDSWIIPARNLLLVTIGAMYGKRIWLNALSGEQHSFAREHDKSLSFYHTVTGLLTYVCEVTRSETIVETPFKEMTKKEIVRWAKDKGSEFGLHIDTLKLTSSCYDGAIQRCGACGTCFKRWIAMINNGIEEDYAQKPWENSYARRTSVEMFEAFRQSDFTHYSRLRIAETMSALEKVTDIRKYIDESREMLKA